MSKEVIGEGSDGEDGSSGQYRRRRDVRSDAEGGKLGRPAQQKGSPVTSETDRPVARELCDVRDLTAHPPPTTGVLWKLAEPGRQLDANVVHLPPGEQVQTHAEPELDVLLLVVAGSGSLGSGEGLQPLTEGSLIWLPRESGRSLAADDDGLSYLTVHRRRPGMQIQYRGRAAGTPD